MIVFSTKRHRKRDAISAPESLLGQLHRDARRRIFHRRADERPGRVAREAVPGHHTVAATGHQARAALLAVVRGLAGQTTGCGA